MVGIESEFEGTLVGEAKVHYAANGNPYARFLVRVQGSYQHVWVTFFTPNAEAMVGSTLVDKARVWVRGLLTLKSEELCLTAQDVRFPRG